MRFWPRCYRSAAFPEKQFGRQIRSVGKSGIFDHNWSAAGQAARIYKAEVVEEPGKVTAAGEPGCYLKGWAYMLRTKANAELIAQIEGGIKKEVSVGCSVEREVCSVCGEAVGSCRHVKGRTYNGKLCYGELTGAKDAYEWSFVAVPAQREAGVIKGMGPTLKELVRGQEKAREEAEHFCPWNSKEPRTMAAARGSMSAVAWAKMKSLPPVSPTRRG